MYRCIDHTRYEDVIKEADMFWICEKIRFFRDNKKNSQIIDNIRNLSLFYNYYSMGKRQEHDQRIAGTREQEVETRNCFWALKGVVDHDCHLNRGITTL